MNTIKDLIKQPEDFEIYWGDFLDYFYHNNQKEKQRIVKEEPKQYQDLSQKTYAFVAAAVEKLCNDSNIEPPNWVFKDKYFLKDPMFSLDAKGDLRTILLLESPHEFIVRNIFVSENCLERV